MKPKVCKFSRCPREGKPFEPGKGETKAKWDKRQYCGRKCSQSALKMFHWQQRVSGMEAV